MVRPATIIGVDVGGTKVAAGQVADGKIEHDYRQPIDLSDSETVIGGIEQAVAEVKKYSGPPTAIGVGVPSAVEFATGRVLSSANIPLRDVALRKELTKRLGVPTYIDNDGNCSALAEAHLLGDSVQCLVMLTLGTGVGGGIIVGGNVFRGSTGLGAELGHVSIKSDGPECTSAVCKNPGCLESLCSGQALERDAKILALEKPASELGKLMAKQSKLTGQDVAKLAYRDDKDALNLFESLGRNLGVGLANLINTFEPEYILIGGGLSEVGDLFMETARFQAAERALPAQVKQVEIKLAASEATAGVLGAGILALQEHKKPNKNL